MNLGRIVQQRRIELGMSQEELATKMGYKSRSSINKIENGRPVTQKIIVRLAEALNTTPAHLMGWDQEELDTVASVHNESLEDTNSLDQIIGEMYADKNLFISNQRLWMDEVGETSFSPEEIKQIMEYAKFLISQRKDDKK